MKTIVIASRKGGVGKTTTTRNLAVALSKRKYSVLMIDTDSQGSLTEWWNARENEQPQLLVVSYEQLGTAIKNAKTANYDFVLIDTPPESNDVIQHTVQFADFVLIPLKASVDDLRAIGQTIRLVQQCGKPFSFVLNEIKANTNLTREMAEAVSQYGSLAPSQASRVIHIECAVNGLTCNDVRPSSSASRDVDKLVDFILTKTGVNK